MAHLHEIETERLLLRQWHSCEFPVFAQMNAEGASAALAFAFNELSLPEVVAFTTLSNAQSERVMKQIGMQRDDLTFQHPSLPAM